MTRLHPQAHKLLVTARDFSAIETASPELQLAIVNLVLRMALDEPVRRYQFNALFALLKIKERAA
jgi:hypothetical protein